MDSVGPQRLDPKVRPELREALMGSLYQKDTDAAEQSLHTIMEKHCQITETEIRGFTFMGKTHYAPGYLHKKPIHALHPDLHAEMLAWVQDRRTVEKEEKLIVGNLITAVLNTSDSPEDWKKLLPPAIHSVIDWFISYKIYSLPPPKLTDAQVEAFERKQERFLNILKGRLALNLIF